MLFGSDLLANFYLGCFLFGLIFTAVSLVLGATHFGGGDVHADAGGHGFHPGHVDTHTGHAGHLGHLGHAGHADVGHPSADGAHDGIGWLNLPTILAFITWFGGSGYLLYNSVGIAGILSGVGAVVFGLIGAAIMFLLLAKVLWPGQGKPMSRAEYQMRGTSARVVSRIAADGGVGEIVYVKGGVRSTIGARSESREAIERGSEVVVVRYERGLAHVVSVDAVLGTHEVLELPTDKPTLPLGDIAPPADKART